MAPFAASPASAAGGPLAVHLDGPQTRTLSAGITQRAQLAALLVADLAGDAKVIADGILPPDVVANTLGWSTPLSSRNLGGTSSLLLTGLELVRNADTNWTVLTDRTSLPRGAGLISDFPHPDATSFLSVLQAQIALRSPEPPVLLHDPDAAIDPLLPPDLIEQDAVALAQALGITLRTPGELRVHAGHLVESEAGAREIRSALRYVPVRSLDPLEPRSLRTRGIPGLAAPVRSGNLQLVNPPAAVIHSNPALANFLPKIARHLLGEELKLPPVTTYWCGERLMCSHTIASVSRLVVQSISTREIRDGRFLTMSQSAELCARISDEPRDWVSQEPVEPEVVRLPDGATAPLLLRAFAAGGDSSWTALAGGLGFVGELDAPARQLAHVAFSPEAQ